MTWTDTYRDRANADNLARQAPPVREKAKEILKQLKDLDKTLYWSMDPDESDGGAQWAASLIEHAHALLDQAHEYRQALALNPPPKINDESSLQSTR